MAIVVRRELDEVNAIRAEFGMEPITEEELTENMAARRVRLRRQQKAQ